MTQFDKIFKLTKKLSQALLKDKGFRDLENSDVFSEEAKIHIKQLLTEEEIKENLELLNQIDKEAGWKQIQDRMSKDAKIKPRKSLSMPPFFKVAAIVVLLVALTYVIFEGRTTNTGAEVAPVTIMAGTDKAILTLEDGSEVILEKGTSFKKGNVHSNGERLEYEKANTNTKTVFNYLTIPRGGHYQIVLSDSTVVWLNAETKLKYPVNFVEGEPRNLELVYGEAYFKVSPSTKHLGSVFKVVTKMQDLVVVGTEFNIKAYKDEDHIYTTLVEGMVNIGVDENTEHLKPGERSTVSVNTKTITKNSVTVDYDIAWVKGYFNFKDKPLKDIMTVLSRWYDVDITFEIQDLETIRFTGLLKRQQNIQDILNGFKNTKFINAYDIKNRTITIQ